MTVCKEILQKKPMQVWAERFEVPCSQLPCEFVEACNKKMQPEKSLVLAAVRDVAYEIKKFTSNSGAGNLPVIAIIIIGKYPEALADQLPGIGVLGDGSTTLTNRLV